MRTTKKIVSAVLAACMLASTAVVSSFAATADDSSAVSSDYARDNSYTKNSNISLVTKMWWQNNQKQTFISAICNKN